MGLFSRKPAPPDAACPQCGEPKPASLPVCTTCRMREAAAENPRGFPGSDRDRAGRGQRAEPWRAEPARVEQSSSARAPAAAGGDPYALTPANYPVRTKAGFNVRSDAEAAVADHFFERGLAVAYEPVVAGHRPTFSVPTKETVIEVRGRGSPLADWQVRERESAYRAYGFSLITLDASRGDVRKELEKRLPS